MNRKEEDKVLDSENYLIVNGQHLKKEKYEIR